MTSYEEHNLHTNPYWQARLERERRSISESVEETLADPLSQEAWSDEEQQYVPVDPSPSSTQLVPPQISLRSKVLPSIRPASFVQSVTAELAARQIVKEQEEQRKPQSTNMLARLAQRLTSSIAAIMLPDTPNTPIWTHSAREQEASSQERHLATLAPTYAVTPLENLQNATVIDAIPATPSQSLASPVKSKQRLAGHTAKVHLQTTPLATVMPYPQERPYSKEEVDVYGWSQETKEPLREPLTVNVRFREREQEIAAPQSKAASPHKEIQVQQETHVEKSAILASNTGCTTFFGTGTFEKGQGELMVHNSHTVAMSVVYVTLTSNPGPTLVQYVTLLPDVGFTLHLTAPTDVKTTFNYVMFVDNRN